MLNFSPYTILFTVINLLVLWLFLKHFLFEKVTAILDHRAQAIQKDREDAAGEKLLAGQLHDQYERQLAQTRQESETLLAHSRAQAQKEYEATLDSARTDAQKLMETTRLQLQTERENMLRGVRKEVAQLALLAAAKVAQSELDRKNDLAMVDSFLYESGDLS
ncbi:F0F1 ATP synthase subunit B [Oscillibacter sp. GMB15532]|uniref:F0F1 ATP synthase subunit B n=1 Tax=Oscillibacter sp. GMB15532 TaxID=3230022 RepID=UPI0034DDFA23